VIATAQVWDALHAVIDPELGLDFVDLGLVYEVRIEPGSAGADVHVLFTLTSPACAIGPQVAAEIEEAVGTLDGVRAVFPRMTFSPPWTPERMSEDARFALGL
jgi:metal-sulfur cluster biosynthetic enzyme